MRRDAQLLLNLRQDLAAARVQNPRGDGFSCDPRIPEHVVEYGSDMLPGNGRNVRLQYVAQHPEAPFESQRLTNSRCTY